MLYINEEYLVKLELDWAESIDVIEKAVQCLGTKKYVQPLKPYLRFKDMRNRIIAMPAFLGGTFNIAGIKWIASFPDNISKGLPRAHSVVILNSPDTGIPIAIINTALLSVIRTASVSGLVIKHFNRIRRKNNINIGIIGWGPIGQYHLKMCMDLLSESIASIYLFDKRTIDRNSIETACADKVVIADSWETVYQHADIFMTCTVADEPYIDRPPKPGSLHLNISLRDYKPEIYEFFKDAIIVDDWDEVCREKTDIENLHLYKGLNREMTKSIIEIISTSFLEDLHPDIPVFFNPMGMAVFDIAIGNYYYERCNNSANLINNDI